MATTSPIDVERYLLQGEGEEGLDVRDYLDPTRRRTATTAPAVKPNLDDALLKHYNSIAPAPLKPGELPPPVEAPVAPAEPGILDKAKQYLPSIPSISLPGFGGSTGEKTTTTSADTQSPSSNLRMPSAPAGTEPSSWYSTIQKHAGFVRDSMEAAGKTIAGIGAFGVGAAGAVNDILWGELERVARSGPTALGRPHDDPDHYTKIFKRMNERIAALTPEPRSDIAKNVNKAVGTVTELVKDVAELPGKGLVYTGILTEDQAKLVSFAVELALFAKLDHGVRTAAPELRAKIANFRSRTSKATSDADIAAAAEDLATAAAKNPKLDAAMDEARGKFRDEADREAGRPPRGPQPEDPTGGGAYFDPADIATYQEQLRNFTDFYKSTHPNASFSEFKEALNFFNEGVAPKPKPRPAPEAPPRPATDNTINFEQMNAENLAYQNAIRQRTSELQRERPGITSDELRAELNKIPKPGERLRTEAEAPRAAPQPEAPQPQAARSSPEPTRPTEPPTPQQRIMDAYSRLRDADPAVRRAALEEIRNSTVIGESLEGSLRRWGVPDDISADILRRASEIQAEAARPAPEPQAPTADPRAGTPPTIPRVTVDDVISGRVSPTTQPQVAPVTERPVAPEVVAPQQAAATVAPETVPAPVSPEPTVAAVTPSSRQGYFGWEGTHTAASAISRAQELGILDKIRTELNQGVSPADVAAIVRPQASGRIQRGEIEAVVEAIRNDPEAALAPLRDMLNTGKLAELKSLARDAAEGSNLILGLTRLGFPREEVRAIAEQLRTIRARRAGTETLQQVAEKPAVQTAATEAALEFAPAGTEVEIPAPAEPVVDTSPAIEKPKRKRRIVKASDATEIAGTATQSTVTETSIPAGVTTPDTRYYGVRGVNMLSDFINSVPEIQGGTTLPRAPIQVRAKPGAKPDAIFIDTAGLSTRTKLFDIDAQETRGRMSEETATALRDNLRRQAELSGKLLEEAHTFTGEELLREATRIAAETGVDLYVRKGKNYELVPKDVVRTDARLNRGDDLAATPISKEAAGAYVESKTSDIGPDALRGILEAIEKGVDITDRLPSEMVPHYKQMRETERSGLDTSERRAFIDMLTDLYNVAGEILRDESGAINMRTVRMAAQRLQADMRKAGKTVKEFLFGANPNTVKIFEDYLDTINNPVPPTSTNPRNMRFDPENVIPGDRVVKHRTVSVAQSLNAVPLWQSEVKGLQGARDITPGGTPWDIKLPLRQHKAAGTEFLYYAYRTSQSNLNAELNTLHSDMQELSRGFSSRSLENVGANGYARQGPDGQRILAYNKVTPRPLSPAERRLQATIDGIYAETFNRLQETRAATGREPLSAVQDYQTFARTFNVLNALGIKIDLARATAAEVNAAYIKHKSTNFPYVVRKHAFYTAEMNALKILDTYMQSALKDIHLSPFIAKMHELIETNLPDPVTGAETWQLKDHKPGLYNELRRWTDYLSTGTNMQIPNKQRMILNTLNRNVAYATLSGLIRSGGIQISTLVNTQQALGPINTFKGVVANLTDHLTGGKQRQFAIDNSEILSSRKFVDAYNEVAGAIIGRRPRDFFHAVRTGAFGDLQAAAGRPGFKLMELMDMEAAVLTWNIAYKQARSQAMGYNHKDARRYADDAVVRTQGSSMPGDLSGVQRNALGKLITQFQTFLISDYNFLRQEVLSKGKIGGGGGGQIPPGGVPSGSGSFETGGPRTKTQFVINAIQFLIATQLMNEFFKQLHLQPAQPDPVEDVRKGMAAGRGPLGLAFDIAVGQTERLPVWGGLRYGRGVSGPAIETVRDLARGAREDPLTRNPYQEQLESIGIPSGEAAIMSKMAEPASTLIGVPFTRQTAKTALALKRGENVYDSLLGWYSQDRRAGGRTSRGERRDRRSR